MRRFLVPLFILLFIGCGEEVPKEEKGSEFKPPETGKVTEEQARKYVDAAKYLMEAIERHEDDIQEFTRRYRLSADLSELSDSAYCKEHPEVMRTWTRLQDRWNQDELKAYKRAGISEDEFNWIGGALADTINQEIQVWVQGQLRIGE